LQSIKTRWTAAIIFTGLAGAAIATPVTFNAGSTLTINETGTVAVDLLYIDENYTGVNNATTPPSASECPGASCQTAVNGTGSGTYNISTFADTGSFVGLNGTVTVQNLCRDTGPGNTCPNPTPVNSATSLSNFITFSTKPTWSIGLTLLEQGDFTTAGCAGAPGSGTAGQTCSVPNSPFDLTNTGDAPGGPVTGVDVSYTFLGSIVDAGGTPSPIKGTFSTTFSGTDLQTILFDINAGDAVLTGATGTLVVQSTIPEPSTFALILIGGALIGVTRFRRRRA